MKNNNTEELAFEDELIEYLQHVGASRQWKYEEGIKTTNQLWANFRKILEQNNQDKLDGKPLSDTEFSQVKKQIESLDNPYKAGIFLYGVGGKSQVSVERDEDGKSVILTVFDQDQIGGGNTVYQMVNQIQRDPVISGKKPRRFDVTLLINGLPIIQIEEKRDSISTDKAFNQMKQYLSERQYSGIYSTLQIIIGMTRNEIRYMALPNDADHFNTDFAFEWQDEKTNRPIHDWQVFASKVLSIPMAHQLATNYMILDGTPYHQMIKVMRPYQVYATRRVMDKIKAHDFEVNDQRLGYIWHTTGSGKTISSFKAAWLASRQPNVDKVVFLVDRIALTNQTVAEYKAYDPENDTESSGGVVKETANVSDLSRKLKKKGNSVIVTSTQKMATLVRRREYTDQQHVVFIVDEAHRSTSGDMIKDIKKAFPHSAWIGYTGTPVFDDETMNGTKRKNAAKITTTRDIFGDPLHIYTIREAIADRNVLGFKVDFQTTLPKDSLENEYLPKYFKKINPTWTDEHIKERIRNLTPSDMDDLIQPSVYDNNQEHVRLVVTDIFKYWSNRSNKGLYSAILTTHVGGGKASTPMAMMYYDEFQRQNKLRPADQRLKVAITFSQDTSNGENQYENNQGLSRAIKNYNAEFGTGFDDTTVKEYTEDVVNRLARNLGDDAINLDLVIVVDQLLTGFNAPMLNTLYVDRTLKGANLIQAYSRTNRVQDMEKKPFGRIVNYRWPQHAEDLMNKALTLYANRQSATVQGELIDRPDGIVEKSYAELVDELAGVVKQIKNLTDNFDDVPKSENAQVELWHSMHRYNHLMVKIKQDDNYDEKHPEKLFGQVNMNAQDETALTGRIATKLNKLINQQRGESDDEMPMPTLRMEHVNDVRVNYDYIEELLAQLANQLHDGDEAGAQKTHEQLQSYTNLIEDEKYAAQLVAFIKALFDRAVQGGTYPLQGKDAGKLLRSYAKGSESNDIEQFMQKWGLMNLNKDKITHLIQQHTLEHDDLDTKNELGDILNEAQKSYQTTAHDQEVRNLKRMKYRTHLRQAFNDFADTMKRKY
ncbi:type I restriction endonuclease subunit R [Limosilactobacillus mucosae]